MTYNPKIYGQLLIETLPGAIVSQEEYDRVEKVFAGLFNQERSPEQERLFDLLATLLEDFERRTLPPLTASTPLETLKFLMTENNLKQKDVVEIFGSQSVASSVLSGKRDISKAQAKKLAEAFKLKADVFL